MSFSAVLRVSVVNILNIIWRCSSVGRASGSYPLCPGFESLHRYFEMNIWDSKPTRTHPVDEEVRAAGFEGGVETTGEKESLHRYFEMNI